MISTDNLDEHVPHTHKCSWVGGWGWFHGQDGSIIVMSMRDRVVMSVWGSDLGPRVKNSTFMRIT